MVAYDASIEVDKHYMAEALALATRGGTCEQSCRFMSVVHFMAVHTHQ